MKKLSRGFKSRGQTEAEKESKLESSMLDTIESELEEEGIYPFDNERISPDYLRLPPDLTDIESRELGRYFSTFTAQKVYVRTLLGRTGAVLRELNDKLDDIRESVYKELPSKMSIKEKELSVRGQNSKTVELMREVSKLEEKKKMLSDYLESLADVLFCISREVTRRESIWAEDKRDYSISKKDRRN